MERESGTDVDTKTETEREKLLSTLTNAFIRNKTSRAFEKTDRKKIRISIRSTYRELGTNRQTNNSNERQIELDECKKGKNFNKMTKSTKKTKHH